MWPILPAWVSHQDSESVLRIQINFYPDSGMSVLLSRIRIQIQGQYFSSIKKKNFIVKINFKDSVTDLMGVVFEIGCRTRVRGSNLAWLPFGLYHSAMHRNSDLNEFTQFHNEIFGFLKGRKYQYSMLHISGSQFCRNAFI